MTFFNSFSLVNWSMGAAIIGVFAVVCIVLVLIVVNMMNSDKKKTDDSEGEQA